MLVRHRVCTETCRVAPLVTPETGQDPWLYPRAASTYTSYVALLYLRTPHILAALCVLAGTMAAAQEPAAKPAEKPVEKLTASEKVAEKPALPFQAQLLETHV